MLSIRRIASFLCIASACAAATDAPLSRAKAAFARLPLRFELNQGQFDPSVRFAARAGDWKLLLKNQGPTLTLPGAQNVELSLLHSNPAPRIEALDRLTAHTDYFIGTRQNWHANIANYSRVAYRDVYPGVDVVYYGRDNRLEYDFVLQPGADPAAIRMQFRGARRLRVTPEGDVAFEAADGRMIQKRPVIYQQDRTIGGRYVLLSHNVIGLKLDRYDRTRPLTIDPVLVYSTYFGGPLTDQIIGVKVDSKGLLYVVGATDHSLDTNYPDLAATGNTYQGTNAGFTDAFVAIFDPGNGYNLLYLSYLGGSGIDTPRAMQIDASGNVYLAGTTTSTDFPIAGNAVTTSGAGATTFAFVSAINPDLANGQSSLTYSTYLGTNTNTTFANGIDVDNNGFIYVIGTTRASDFPVTDTAYQQVLWGQQDAFLCKLSLFDSNLQYSTFLGSEASDDGRSIAVTPDGSKIYFAINTFGQQFPQAGNQYQAVPRGPENIIIGQIDMNKTNVDSLIYTTYFGGSTADEARKIAIAANGDLLVTGHTLSSDFPVTGDAAQLNYGGNGDAFVSVVNPANPKFIVYSTYLGGAHGEVAYDVAGDRAGSIYVTGYTLSSNFPVTRDAVQTAWGYGIDAFLTKIKPGVPGLTALQYSSYFGGVTVNVSYGVAIAPDGTVYIAGYTGGLWNVSDNATQASFGGGYSDGFIVGVK